LASQEGHSDVVSFLLKHGAIINHKQSDGATPLLLAAQFGHDQVVDILMKWQASTTSVLNGKVTSAMQLAMQSGHCETTQLMLRQTRILDLDHASQLLLFASYRGYAGVVKLLLDLKVDPEVCIFLNGNQKATPLMAAVVNGQTDVVDVLLKHNADLTTSWMDGTAPPLIVAIHLNHTDIVDLILNHAPDLVNKGYGQAYGPYLITPLEHAIQTSNLKTFKCLLKHGADPRLTMAIPVSIMCQLVALRKTMLVKSLLDHGDNPNHPCQFTGPLSLVTPLSMAVEHENVEIAKLLLNYGADNFDTFPTNTTISFLAIAKQTGKSEAMRQLFINDLEKKKK
jgi:ankyrin repeat protein